MLDIEVLAEDAMREDGVDRKKVMAILAKGLRNKMPEIDVYEEVYREVYGDELTPEKCEELIAMLYQGEEHGAKWSLGDTNGVASKLDIRFDEKPYTPEMFRAAMHVKYYDNAVPLKKSGKEMSNTDWGRMGDFYFTAEDEEKSCLVDYYFQKMRNAKKKMM